MRLIFLLLLCTKLNAQWNYNAGVLVPMPFYVPSDYIVHPSSAMGEVSYRKNNIAITGTTGYIRLKGEDLFQSLPVIFGGKFYADKFSIGAGFGPSRITEFRDESYKMIYNFKIGYNPGRWIVELNYFNWEELPDELNTLAVGIFYNLTKQRR